MYVLVGIIALLFSFLNSIAFFSGLLHQKPGEMYLGTIHYYEDYFFYLSHFFQGAHGAWLTANRYTNEMTSPSFLFWPNIILGKIGGFLGIPPIFSYNISVFLLSFATLVTIFLVLKKMFRGNKTRAFVGFILAVTATSFMNHIWVDGKPMWYPFQLWKTPNFAFDRLGGVPHQLLQTLLFLLLTLVWFSKSPKRPVTLVILMILLTSLNPVISGLFLAAAWATFGVTILLKKKNRDLPLLLFISIGFAVMLFFYNTITNTQPHLQSKLWETTQQIYTTPLFMLLSIGPIALLGIFGLVPALKRRNFADLFCMILLFTCYALTFSPVPAMIGVSSSRILFPGMYIAWGYLGAEGIYFLVSQIVRVTSVGGPPRRGPLVGVLGGKRLAGPAHVGVDINLVTIFLIIYLLFALPILHWELEQKLLVKPQERIPLLYLPRDVYQTFQYLSTQGLSDDIVLASPLSHMDAMIPALTGHTSFTGHPFATISSNDKKALSSRFFQRLMTQSEAQQWLANNKIKYVFFSSFDTDKTQFQKSYPFLKEIYSTTGATIFTINP